jgi:mannose-1-phosphate guanylyltransferase
MSRESSPKQLLRIVGEHTMIQNTVARLAPLIPPECVYIVTNAHQSVELRKQLPQIPDGNILIEPLGRNTAPAIAFGAEIIKQRHGDSVMVVLPADHIVQDVAKFQHTLSTACTIAAESRALVTIGITPTHPETGYGYIQFKEGADGNPYNDMGAYPVKTFAEKPNLATAKSFIESGDFVWNSGMFVWKASTILNCIAEFLPDVSEEFHRLRTAIDTDGFPAALEVAYREMQAISIDYGVMEKAKERFVIPVDFGWNDLGSWDEVFRISPKDADGNTIDGPVIARDVHNCHVVSKPGVITALIDVDDVTVINTGDAVLIFKHGRSQEVKEIVEQLRRNNKTRYL